MKKILTLSVLSILLIQTSPSFAATTVRKVTGGYCMYSKSWKPATKSGKSYSLMSSSNKAYKNLTKSCKGLFKPSAVNLKNSPSVSDFVKSAASTSAISSLGLKTSSVSGTPPTLSELGSSDAASIFFSSGVLTALSSGSPTESDCEQFFSSTVDGRSGGISSCFMAQNVGESMGNLLQSGTDACYMQNIPTAAARDNSVARVTTGALPTGGWNALFSSPASSARIVKIVVPGESRGNGEGEGQGGGESSTDVFIRVASESENLSRGLQYKANLYFCNSGETTAAEESQFSISSDNIFSSRSFGISGEGGRYDSSLSARLIASGGSLVFDSSATKTAQIAYVASQGGTFKGDISVGNGRITSKILDQRDVVRKAYYLADYTGNTVPELRFLAGAFKEYFSFSGNTQNHSGGTEYRDTGYRAAPTSALVTSLDSVNFDTDTFYSTTPDIPSSSIFTCNTSPDIEIELDMSSPGMTTVQQTCETARLDSRSFCQSEAISAAQNGYFRSCLPH